VAGGRCESHDKSEIAAPEVVAVATVRENVLKHVEAPCRRNTLETPTLAWSPTTTTRHILTLQQFREELLRNTLAQSPLFLEKRPQSPGRRPVGPREQAAARCQTAPGSCPNESGGQRLGKCRSRMGDKGKEHRTAYLSPEVAAIGTLSLYLSQRDEAA
jgi:hypothetical protein